MNGRQGRRPYALVVPADGRQGRRPYALVGRAFVPALCLAVWLAHAALLAWMAGADVVQVLLSGGGASLPLLAGAGAFVGLRLVVRLVLPGVLLAWTGALVWERLTRRPRPG